MFPSQVAIVKVEVDAKRNKGDAKTDHSTKQAALIKLMILINP